MKRLREHLQMYGPGSLSTSELLACVLSSGSAQPDVLKLVSKLIEQYGVRHVRQMSEVELVGQGLTPTKAQALRAMCELAPRLCLPEPGDRPQIRTAGDAVALLRPFMAHLDHEEFRVLVLDTKYYVVANLLLYQGSVNSSVIRVAEVYRAAVIRNCPALIAAHFHPSLDPSESPEDREVTQQLVEAGRLLEIELVDHLILGNPGYVSLREVMRWS